MCVCVCVCACARVRVRAHVYVDVCVSFFILGKYKIPSCVNSQLNIRQILIKN